MKYKVIDKSTGLNIKHNIKGGVLELKVIVVPHTDIPGEFFGFIINYPFFNTTNKDPKQIVNQLSNLFVETVKRRKTEYMNYDRKNQLTYY